MFKSLDEIDLNWLKNNHQRLYYFGLGFIQLKINEEYRLHFYTPELPAFVDHPHNHRYDFTSLILKGEITNKIYQEVPGSKYLIQEDSCSEGFVPSAPAREGDFQLVSKLTYSAGQSYSLTHEIFHTVQAKSCITLLKRSEYRKNLAEVSYLKGQEKICPFKEKIPEAQLWDLIAKELN